MLGPFGTKIGSKMVPKCFMGRSRRQIATRSAPGGVVLFGVVTFLTPLGRKWLPRGDILDPAGSKTCSKIAFLRVAWLLYPPKMDSGKGF